MDLNDLSEHDRAHVRNIIQYLSHNQVPTCGCCGFPHGLLDILAMDAFEARGGNRAEAEHLLREALAAAIATQQAMPGVRSVSDAGDTLQEASSQCDECDAYHPFFDFLALAVLCGLKTQQDLETGFTESFIYIQQFMRSSEIQT